MDGLAAAFTSALALGLRHGFDWDHIAALSDITGSDDDTRRSLRSAFLYIVGHAAVVAVLGVAAVAVGRTIPPWLDAAMGRVVGATLLALGVYVLVSLVRHGRDARLRSRWMLAIAGVRRAAAIVIRHEHEHPVHEPHHGEPHDGDRTGAAEADRVATATTHRHEHVHLGTLPDDPFGRYTSGTAFGVGALHGIGAETPTQMLLFATAAGAGGALTGSVLVAAFVLGLMVSNTVVALLTRYGVLNAARNFAVFAAVSVVVAAVSIYLGAVFLLDAGEGLPAVFA